MLAVPPRLTGSDVDRAIAKVASRAKHRDEAIDATWRIWMPYHRLCIRCDDTNTSTPQSAVTLLNAMFCGNATQGELIQLFRPKHLEKRPENIDPQADEIICPHPTVDLNQILGRLLERRAQVEVELAGTKQQLSKDYRNMQWRYLLLPMSTRSLEREKQLSSKFAELQSTSLAIDICLNVAPGLTPQSVEAYDVLYIPMAVVQVKQRNDLTRYLLIDLTTMKEDSSLTELCEIVDSFNSEIDRALHSST
jgi:hypothetical protein